MTRLDPQNSPELSDLEHRISCLLDHELPGEAQAELYREILRDPAAHEQLSRMSALDQKCGEALRAGLDLCSLAVDRPLPSNRNKIKQNVATITAHRQGRPIFRQLFAIAASVALLLGGGVLTLQLIPAEPGNTAQTPQLAQTEPEQQPQDSSPTASPAGRPASESLATVSDVDTQAAVAEMSPPATSEMRLPRDFVGIADPGNSVIFFIELPPGEAPEGMMEF